MPGIGHVSYFYPRSPCGERRKKHINSWADNIISIHALLAESDNNILITSQYRIYFYPRSPCGERLLGRGEVVRRMSFLSTLSLRRATSARPETRQRDVISIHALLAESDQSSAKSTPEEAYFYPRSPCGERLGFSYFYIIKITISIHALLAESDYHTYTYLSILF